MFNGFSILSPSWLWLVMPALFVLVVAFAWLASGRRLFAVRRVPAWRSATAGVSGRASYTAFGFANPTRRILAGDPAHEGRGHPYGRACRGRR